MTRWIVRQGVAGGLYLWGADPWQWSLGAGGAGGAGVFTAGGGQWSATPTGTVLTPWWHDGQRGALRYDQRDEAYRVAAKLGGRVVKLVQRTTSAQGRKDDAG